MATRPTYEALLQLLTGETRSAFIASIQAIVDDAILQEVVKAINENNAQKAFELLGFNPAVLRPFIAAVERAYDMSGEWVAGGYPQRLQTSNGMAVFRFDSRNTRSEQWLKAKSSTLISRLTNEARDNVKTVLQTGMERGSNPRNTALDIVGRVNRQTGKREGGIVGLTPHQLNWSISLRRDLEQLSENYFTKELRDKRFDSTVRKAIDSGKPLTAEVIGKLVGRYNSNALKYRGDSIARTESLHALNAAEYESTKQIVDIGAARPKDIEREWDSAGDTRVRPDHKKMDGQKVGLDEPFTTPAGVPMMHPGDTSLGAGANDVISCRCRVKTVVNWIAAGAAKYRGEL